MSGYQRQEQKDVFRPLVSSQGSDIIAPSGTRPSDNLRIGKSPQHFCAEVSAMDDNKRFPSRAPNRKVDRSVADIILPLHAESGDQLIRLSFAGQVRAGFSAEDAGDATDPFSKL